MHTCIIIYVYLFYMCKYISIICLLVDYLLFLGVKNKLLVLLYFECSYSSRCELHIVNKVV